MENSADWISAGANAIVACAAAFAAYHGWKGLSIWRQEMIGRRKAELAEGVLSDFYQFRDTIKTVRSPHSYPASESAERPRSDTETPDDTLRLDGHYVPIARIEAHKEFFGDLLAKRYRMKALFGGKVDAPYDAANKALRRIQTAASMMIRTSRTNHVPANNELWHRWAGSSFPARCGS